MRGLAVIGAMAIAVAFACALYAAWVVRGGFAARDQPSAVETQVARLARRLAVSSKVRALANPLTVTPELLAHARAHWADHCAVCHANDGSGDTQLGRNLYPKAPDMRAPATQQLSDGELYDIIQNGVRLSGMPAWGEAGKHDDQGSWSLVALIRTLAKLTPGELQEMERMNPKSLHEWQEQQEEEEFLRGDAPLEKHQH